MPNKTLWVGRYIFVWVQKVSTKNNKTTRHYKNLKHYLVQKCVYYFIAQLDFFFLLAFNWFTYIIDMVLLS